MDISKGNLSFDERFQKFLEFRGVRRVTRREAPTSTAISEIDRNLALLGEHDDDNHNDNHNNNNNNDNDSHGSEDDENLSDLDIAVINGFLNEDENEEEIEDNVDYFRFIRDGDNLDADVFYSFRRESFGSGGNTVMDPVSEGEEDEEIDKDVEYVALGLGRERRYTNNTGERIPVINDELSLNEEKFPLNSSEAYEKWEFHNGETRTELNAGHGSDGVDCNEGTLIYAQSNSSAPSQDLSEVSNSVRWPPAMEFEDTTIVRHLRFLKLSDLEYVRRYKNNISSIITDNEGNDYLITAASSKLVVFGFDVITHLPEQIACLLFETKPFFTSTTDRLVSTWPYFPHTINFIKVYNNFLGKQVIGACVDDGSLLIWYAETILKHLQKYEDSLGSNEVRFSGLRIKPDFQVKMEASLWGLDFKSYKDPLGNEHHLVVGSDNSQSVVLLYYHPGDNAFYHVKTHQILQNIPEVSFFNIEFDSNLSHIVKVTCASISGELIIFKFKFRLVSGPLNEKEINKGPNEMYYVDSAMEQIVNREAHRHEIYQKHFHRINFLTPVVISRALLGEDCWTCKPISSKYFKSVSFLRNMVGDPNIDEKKEIEHIMNESKILDFAYDPVKTSDLGLAARWQYFRAPVLNLLSDPAKNKEPPYEYAKLITLDDEYRRIHKASLKLTKKYKEQKYISMNSRSYKLRPQDEQDLSFFLVSTSKRIGIFSTETLFCNSSTKRLFNLDDPLSEEGRYSNRISITAVIPELSVFIAATQQGVLSIMRLCQYRGLYGMRQEHVFPNSLSYEIGYHGYRCITGLAMRNMSVSQDFPRFLIYVTYTDGIVLVYEITAPNSHHLQFNL